MDYAELAAEFLQKMQLFHRAGPHKKVNESMRGVVFILQYIQQQGDAVIPSEISNEMGISTARIAAALGKLEHKGLITRESDPGDRRKILVRLTERGTALAQSQQTIALAEAETMLRLLGERDALEYVRITGRLSELMAAREARTQTAPQNTK